MAVPRRYIIIASSIFLVLIIAIILATSLEIRAAPLRSVRDSLAQLAKDENLELERKGGSINGSAFDRVEILSGDSAEAADRTAPWYLSVTTVPWMANGDSAEAADRTAPWYLSVTTVSWMTNGEGATPTAHPSAISMDEGFIGTGNLEISAVSKPSVRPQPSSAPQVRILALSYAGDGGPKHCRGRLLQKLSLPPPASNWKNGTCVNLPADARCGVFYAGKADNCEAQLFNMYACYNTTDSYVNTVVFMPEERAVGAMWKSMFIRCGIDVPEPALLDPSILGGMLTKPGGG